MSKINFDPPIDPNSILSGMFSVVRDYDHPYTETADQLVAVFDRAVDDLRNERFPSRSINRLMGITWDIIENRIVLVAATEAVPTIHFYCEINRSIRQAAIMVPLNWVTQINENPLMTLGGLVWASSQAVDFYNNRFRQETKQEIETRAGAYEAQFYIDVQTVNQNTFTMNQYQEGIMRRFPQGLLSLDPALRYDPQPFLR